MAQCFPWSLHRLYHPYPCLGPSDQRYPIHEWHLYPYSINSQMLTTNDKDGIMSGEAESIDPVLNYVLLGNSVSDGLMMWTSVGIDASAVYTTSAAATLTENGGVANH
ncbi:hypothetical protein D9758_007017 [Tetrapyrgos nigripes]|uniref:Uncharacterized protein n=1 Tax=Tetrapyrgos nigripes TaxID=182062 RepID=A0A8H5GDE2_9AGAR|nr:hypothetical protein D9758_007017 [Tetrapyrgos nigripes]